MLSTLDPKDAEKDSHQHLFATTKVLEYIRDILQVDADDDSLLKKALFTRTKKTKKGSFMYVDNILDAMISFYVRSHYDPRNQLELLFNCFTMYERDYVTTDELYLICEAMRSKEIRLVIGEEDINIGVLELVQRVKTQFAFNHGGIYIYIYIQYLRYVVIEVY